MTEAPVADREKTGRCFCQGCQQHVDTLYEVARDVWRCVRCDWPSVEAGMKGKG